MNFDVDIWFNGIIGISFLVISYCVLYGSATSSLAFFRYVGLVFGSFIGVCGLARAMRVVCVVMSFSLIRSVIAIDIADGVSAIVGTAAAIAIALTTIKVRQQEKAKIMTSVFHLLSQRLGELKDTVKPLDSTLISRDEVNLLLEQNDELVALLKGIYTPTSQY